MLIDTHCHYDLAPNPITFIREREQSEIVTIGMTNLPSHFEQGFPHVKGFRLIRLALGLHPLNANSHKRELTTFTRNINKTSYIGEVGLDFSNQGIETKEIQLDSFEFILKNISGKGKLVSVHSRRAENDVLQLLEKYNIKKVILHWYTGGIITLRKLIGKGYYFSINSSMIRSKKGQKIISEIPLNQILTETDFPYSSLNMNGVSSEGIKEVINYLTSVNRVSYREIRSLVYSNFRTLTGMNK